jgi:subtilase family serine protease
LACVTAVVSGVLPVTGTATHLARTSPAVAALPQPQPLAGYQRFDTASASAPPTTSTCRTAYYPYFPCYSPGQIRKAYKVGALWRTGLRGGGSVIAIVDSFGSPTIKHDLHVFDRAYNLPDPPKFRIVQPAGKVPAFDGTSSDMRGWAAETTLDVEYAHAIAPKATIILAETPVSETEGVHGFPAMMDSERWLVTHTHVGVISQSFGATEPTFPSSDSILKLRYAFKSARRNHVTVLAASGDLGATDYKKDMQSIYQRRVNSWPSSDPLVTSIGGTQLHLADDGARTQPDSVWNDGKPYGASGGGKSHVFSRPTFQRSVQSVVGTQRGTPDISMNAAVSSRVTVYESFPGQPAGWYFAAGTSEATPIFAGIVALAIQKLGHRLGYLNPALYRLAHSANNGIVDVVGGNNSYAGVTGWPVVAGYDMGTGWGTIDAAKFVPALVAAVKAG